MNQIFLNPMMYEVFKRQHEELIRQAAAYRQWNEAWNAATPMDGKNSNILALVGKKLTSLGQSLVARFGTAAEFQISLGQQNNPGDCN
jgi:uncharacterized phage-associated protein